MLETAYLFVFISLVVLLFFAIRKTKSSNGSKNLKKVTILYFSGIVGWLIYLFFISNNGFIFSKAMPPRFPILVFIPIIVFILYFFKSHKKKDIYEHIPKQWPIYFQSFRVVMELIILMTFTAGIIPIQATFQGYNFEIIFAITAPVIGYFTFVKPKFPIYIAIIWNVVGIMFLFIVVSIMVTSFFLPELWGSTTQLVDIRFTKLPLLLLPAFMVPSAIFVHVYSIIQILKSKKKSNSCKVCV